MKRRKKRHSRHIIPLLLIIELLVIAGLLTYVQLRPMVVKAVILEAGNDIPDINEFLLYKNRKGRFITDLKNIDTNTLGSYDIKIKVGLSAQTARLQIVDTIPPEASVNDLTVLKGDNIQAEDFLTDIKDTTEITIMYQETPDTTAPGEKEVTLVIEDSGGNQTVKKAKLTVLDIKSTVIIEAGTYKDVTIEDFVNKGGHDIAFITDVATLDTGKPAVHEILIDVDGREVKGYIQIVDTTPPKATFKDLEIWKNTEPPEAMTFISNIEDVSGVMAEYKVHPDTTVTGAQKIDIILKDEFGNSTVQAVTLTVLADTEPPKIMGTRNKTVYIGDGVAYRKGVYVIDNRDIGIEVKVDSSDVNLKKEGIYDVIYRAEDSSGNKAELTTTVTVIKLVVTQAMLDEETNKVLEQILTPDMTKLSKAEAIYHWIKKHVGYTGDSDKTDWRAEAYRALKENKGDCFTYYAVAHALLTEADIDNMQVKRVGGKTKHFWNLVNCGDGWYHFDSCPNKDHVETFMLTDKELDAFSKTRGSYYYNRDKSLYPATP